MVTSFMIFCWLVITFDRTDCKRDWVEYKDSWFLFVPEKVTWYEAEKRCESIPGSTMAVPTSPEDNSFILKNIQADVWFGITDENHVGTWTDVNGRLVSYLPFQAGQPDNYLNYEHCIHINLNTQGGWNDLGCTDLKGFVCNSSQPPLPVIKYKTNHGAQSNVNLLINDQTRPYYWNLFFNRLRPQPYINYNIKHLPGSDIDYEINSLPASYINNKLQHLPGSDIDYGNNPLPASYINNNLKHLPGSDIDYEINPLPASYINYKLKHLPGSDIDYGINPLPTSFINNKFRYWPGPNINYGINQFPVPYINYKTNKLPGSNETYGMNNFPTSQEIY